ncbi:site-specific integrase [Kribbella sp. NPDC026611]|uniref:site-specific integrase n=1 Tax=Kribbella sp. NPDC026611 TaxID=3154911 RepID=UPI003408360B
MVADVGRVVEFAAGLRWRVLFPEFKHVAASGFLRDLAASDCSAGTLRSYAYDLLRWLRFLHSRWTPWERRSESTCGSSSSGCGRRRFSSGCAATRRRQRQAR